MTDNKGLLFTILVVTALCFVLTLTAISKIDNIVVEVPEITVPEVNIDTDALATAIASKIIIPETVITESTDTTVTSDSKVDYIYNKLHEEDAVEDKALELADEYILSRGFKKLIEDEVFTDGTDSIEIEDYKDIEEVKIVKSDFNGGNTVTYTLKIYYNIDGDEDDRVRVTIEDLDVTVEDLEFDDDFEDAEVDEDADLISATVSQVKFY